MAFAPPSIGVVSPSSLLKKENARQKLEQITHNQPLYYHYFITELYNVYLQFKEDTKVEVRIGDHCFKVDQKSLERTSLLLQGLCGAEGKDGEKLPGVGGLLGTPSMRHERAYTSLYARHLDRFLFPDSNCGMCLHQLITRNEERADICVVPFPEQNWPIAPSLVSDMNLDKLDEAKVETTAYSVTLMQEDMSPRLQLALPFTTKSAALQVHLTGQKCLHSSTIVEGPLHEMAFLCTLYVGVHSLLRRPIRQAEPFSIATPLRSTTLVNISLSSISRVFLSKQQSRVYKFYDSLKHCGEPNVELINQLGDDGQPYLPDVRLEDITRDGRIQCLSYRYIQSDTKMSMQHFATIIQILHKIHDQGLVHCDIRETNLIFGNDGKGWIIDFDLVRKEGENYPPEYNHEHIAERHKDAKRMLSAHKAHDRHSLSEIMMRANMPRSIIEKVKNMSIDLKHVISSS